MIVGTHVATPDAAQCGAELLKDEPAGLLHPRFEVNGTDDGFKDVGED